jgi:hypothetical protein
MEKTIKFITLSAVGVITAILATTVCLMLTVYMIQMVDFVPKIRLYSPVTMVFEASDIRLPFIPLLLILLFLLLP